MLRSIAGVLAIVGVTGCGCDADLTIRSSPTTQQLRIGESFTPKVTLSGCHDTQPLSDVVTWSSSDTTIAITNSSTGLTTARSPGRAIISAVGITYRQLLQLPLVVVP